MHKDLKIDRVFLITVLSLLFFGFAIFISASMGILAKDTAKFAAVTFKQAFFGLLLGLISCVIFYNINYKIYKKFSVWFFFGSIISMFLVFVPTVGVTINGSSRWINLFGLTTFQPVEILNISFIIYWAAWLSKYKEKIQQFKYGLLPLIVLLGIVGIPVILQPDIDSLFFLGLIGVLMFLVSGGKIRHAFYLFLVGIICIGILAFAKPYVKERILSFVNPHENPLTSGYQIRQALTAIGSGQFFGRGLGQGIQKFKFLPESISDSIFAVLGEEMGFVGCVFVILAFLVLIFRAFRIAININDNFGGLLVVGIVILIASRSFMNIASMLGILPISGVPLAFFSQGGTAMLVTLSEIGIILNISRYIKHKK